MKQNLVQNSNRSSKDRGSRGSVAWDSEANAFSGSLILPLPQKGCSVMWHSRLVAPMTNTARLPLLIWIIKTPTPPHLGRLILQRQDKRTRELYIAKREGLHRRQDGNPFCFIAYFFWIKYKISFCTFRFLHTFVLEWNGCCFNRGFTRTGFTAALSFSKPNYNIFPVLLPLILTSQSRFSHSSPFHTLFTSLSKDLTTLAQKPMYCSFPTNYPDVTNYQP